MLERWQPIPGYEGLYEVSDAGSVRSLTRTVQHAQGPIRRSGRVLQPDALRSGYLQASLNRDGIQRRYLVHRLVLLAFVGEPAPGEEACHGNGIRTDNRLANLRWDTKSANAADRKVHGSEHNANKSHCKHGHEFTPDNTYEERNRKHRMCRECARIRDRKRRRNA